MKTSRTRIALAGEVDNINPEAITRELKRIGDEVKSAGELALKEAKNAGALSAETKGKVDELLVKQGELQARLQEVEQKADRRGTQGDAEIKSIGAQFIESEGYKSWHSGGGMKTSRDAYAFSVKAITSDAASGGDGIAPDRLAGVQASPMRRMTVRQLITPGRTESNVIQYLQETGFTNNADMVAEFGKKPQSSLKFDVKYTS